MLEIRFDKTKYEVALLIWFLVDHSVLFACNLLCWQPDIYCCFFLLLHTYVYLDHSHCFDDV
jgi:hypothetical protein